MAAVRLVLYDAEGREVSESTVEGRALLDAAAEAAVRGMAANVDFHVIEPRGAPFRLYWAGRRAQKVTLEEAVRLLARKGL